MILFLKNLGVTEKKLFHIINDKKLLIKNYIHEKKKLGEKNIINLRTLNVEKTIKNLIRNKIVINKIFIY